MTTTRFFCLSCGHDFDVAVMCKTPKGRKICRACQERVLKRSDPKAQRKRHQIGNSNAKRYLKNEGFAKYIKDL